MDVFQLAEMTFILLLRLLLIALL